jgi:hypothetical protein
MGYYIWNINRIRKSEKFSRLGMIPRNPTMIPWFGHGEVTMICPKIIQQTWRRTMMHTPGSLT